MDLGECTKIHDLALRADYEIASKERELFFELDVSDLATRRRRTRQDAFLFASAPRVAYYYFFRVLFCDWLMALLPKAVDHLESFIADCDRRTELAKKRLAETQEEISAEVAAKVCLVRRRIFVLFFYF